MIKSNIETYLRLKPPINLSEEDIFTYTINSDNSLLDIYLPEDPKRNYINNNKKVYSFKLTNIFDTDANQDEVYNKIGPNLINNALQGYNNTIFCYGQTGSGKTYTMSGSKLWKERGLAPRFVIDLFRKIKNLENKMAYEIYISYLEIYNENAYDLLESSSNDMDKWKKIVVYEDNTSNIILKNLNTIKVTSEKQALDIFMTGNYNRQVGSTPMNMASSRSHAIFTIIIEGRALNSEKIITSKINLVDLAGSERLNKAAPINNTNISYSFDTSTINEAKHINLSLSFLEQVIIALNERNTSNRVHIPYRNSLMTTILKDSLGGNCKTILIANVAIDYYNFEETVSTLRFAVRCSNIENEITVNEHLDVNILVSKLNAENEELRKKLLNISNLNNTSLYDLKSNLGGNDITYSENKLLGLREKDECKILINDYINKKTPVINTRDLNQLYFIIDYLIDYINNKEKIYKEKILSISNSSIMKTSNNSNLITFSNKKNESDDNKAQEFINEYKKSKNTESSKTLDSQMVNLLKNEKDLSKSKYRSESLNIFSRGKSTNNKIKHAGNIKIQENYMIKDKQVKFN